MVSRKKNDHKSIALRLKEGDKNAVTDCTGCIKKEEYQEIDGCGSLDFLFRGLKFHVWEYEDRVWGAETNIYEAGRSQDIEGNYEEVIAREILSWPDMMPGS